MKKIRKIIFDILLYTRYKIEDEKSIILKNRLNPEYLGSCDNTLLWQLIQSKIEFKNFQIEVIKVWERSWI